MVDFSDFPGGAVTQATAQASLNDVTAFIRSNAFNQINFTVKDVTPVCECPGRAPLTQTSMTRIKCSEMLAAQLLPLDSTQTITTSMS